MPDQEILTKLEGLVLFGNVRLGKLLGEGKEKVVLHGVKLDDKEELAIQLYQSNPMFLLNEVDFEFLPLSAAQNEEERHLNILEKLIAACERENPGLFFWHMESLYSRILVGLCEDFEQYNKAVIDTTTIAFQNRELVVVGKKALNRKASRNFLDADWEHRLKEETLRKVIDFVSALPFGDPISFSDPTALLAVVFCEGFFGTIPSKDESQKDSGGLFGDLTSDSPSPVDAEKILLRFLNSTDFKSIVPSIQNGVTVLKAALKQLRGMLLEDAFDRSEQLARMGDRFVMRYNAGRNTLLRGLPRCIRTIEKHLS
jgi:hypothetical protein